MSDNTSKESVNADLANKLKETGLDPEYWLSIIEECLGIQNIQSLNYIQPEECLMIEEKLRYAWEKRALHKLFNIPDNSVNIAEVQEKRKQLIKERNERAHILIEELKKMTSEGKSRLDDIVKENENEIWKILEVPTQYSELPGKSLFDLINHFEKQLNLREESYLKKENLTDEEVLQNSSGGLALEGVFQTKNTEDMFKKREPLLCVPEDFKLVGPEQSPVFEEKEFSSQEEQSSFQKKVEKIGLSLSTSLTAGFMGFGLKSSSNYNHSSESEHTSNQSVQHSYVCTTRYNYIPLASCYFRKDQVRLSPSALKALQEIEKILEVDSNAPILATNCSEFFQRFGSHVNLGPIHFGGIFWWKASMEGVESRKMEEAKKMVSEALNIYVGISYAGFGANVDHSKTNIEGSAHRSNTSNIQKDVQLFVTKTGGPSDADSLPHWKSGLVTSNKTWSVIDRGFQLIPVWQIIVDNHKDEFIDNVKLASCLIDHYRSKTGLATEMMIGQNLPNAVKKANAFLQGIKFWNVSNAEKRLEELREFKTELCKTTGSYSAWRILCLSDKTLQSFLESIVYHFKDNLTENSNLIKASLKDLLEPHIYSTENFTNASLIMRWIYDTDKDELERITVSNFEDLLGVLQNSMGEVLQIAASILSSYNDQRQGKIKATMNISLSLYSFLNSLRKTNQTDMELLMLCIANNSGYCMQHYNFQNLLGFKEIEFLRDQMQDTYKKYTSIRSQCTDRAQAFVLYTGLSCVDEYQKMTLEQKKDRLHFMKKHMAGHLSPEVDKIFQKYSEDCELYKIEEDLRALSHGEARKIEFKKNEIATQLNNIFKEENNSMKNDAETVFDYTSMDKEVLLLLDRLDLQKYFPQKMKNADFHKICQPSLVEEQIYDEKQLPLHFLQKLLMLDYRARYVQCKTNSEPENAIVESIQEEENIDETDLLQQLLNSNSEDLQPQNSNDKQPINPMDVQMSIFHCANDFMRQYLYTKLSFCQFALPLLATLPSAGSIEFPLLAFQEIKKKWKNRSGSSFDMFIKKTEAPIISFIRLCPSSFSKSQLLNWLISKQKHDIFYHRHCRGSTQNTVLMNGVTEIAWYFPGGKVDDTFDDCIAFTNLHGDATEHEQQVKYLAEISSVMVVLYTTNLDLKGKQMLQQLLKSSKALICLCTDKEISPHTKDPKVAQIGLKNRNEADMLQHISETIKSLLPISKERYSLYKCASIARKYGFVVDEDKEQCKQGREQAEILLSLLREKGVSAMKEAFLPLHGDLWKEWCKKDKELTQLKQVSNMNIEQHRSGIESKKQAIRHEQLDKAIPLNTFMKYFLAFLHSGQDSKMYFLQWFRMYLDDLSSKILSELYQQYHLKWSKIKEEKEIKKHKKPAIETMERELEKLSAEIEISTFGLEHILREIGQLYEALESTSKNDKRFMTLPKIAANLMISGYPIELMDGDAAHIPLRWIRAILDELIEVLGDKKLYVLSVLGIQSTGKSTLLNAMFGLQFAVSAGRCTRGAFMQLLEVDKDLRQEMNFDYVLVVDTEGLKAVELSKKNTFNHDNELATFVIGLGNLTLINIFGENPSEMQDVLQIAVQAFLRMKKVNLQPSCVFVHQNVGEITAKEKNMEGRRRLQEKLDEMTLCAAQQEQCDVTCFNDVIKFDVNTHIHYFAHLWEGDPPMAPPNPSYSQNVQMLRQVILESGKQEGQHNILHISKFKTRINDLWNALLNENFVFSFKNSLEIAAYNKVEVNYSQWTWKLREHMMTIQRKIRNQIYNGEINEVDRIFLNEELKKIYSTVQGELKEFFDGDKDREILVQWRVNIEKRVAEVKEDMIEEIFKKSNELIKTKDNSKTINTLREKYEDEMLVESKKLALSLQGTNVTDEELRDKFNRMWNKLITKVSKDTYMPEKPQIDRDLKVVFFERFKNIPNIVDTVNDSNRWTDLLEEFSKYMSSKTKYIFFTEKLKDDTQKAIIRIMQILKMRLDEYIALKQQEKLDYQYVYFHELLNMIECEIRQVLETFKYKKEFILYASLFYCQKAARKFKIMSEAFREANDPLVYLASKRDELWQSFKISCEGKKEIRTLADFLCNKLEEAIQHGVYEKSAIYLAGEVKTNHQALNGNRSKLEFCLLRSLAKKENFQSYVNYINDPKSVISNFVKECAEEYCNKTNIPDSLNIHLDEFRNIILKAISKSATIVQDKQGGISEWLDTFCSQLGSELKLSSHDLKSVKYQNITDIDFLMEAMTQALHTVVKKLKNIFSKYNVTNLTKMIHEIIFKQFSGCWAQCPFCSAVCTNTISGHSGDHSVQYHRPRAIRGGRWIDTDHFVIEICSSLVSSNVWHVKNDGKSFPYKTYRDGGHPYNTWSITPDNSSLSYWKWVTAFFQHNFENHYKSRFTGQGTIPLQWAQIRKQEAIDELEKHM